MSSDYSVYKLREWYGAEFEPRLVIVRIYSYGYEICDRCSQTLTKPSVMVVGRGWWSASEIHWTSSRRMAAITPIIGGQTVCL